MSSIKMSISAMLQKNQQSPLSTSQRMVTEIILRVHSFLISMMYLFFKTRCCEVAQAITRWGGVKEYSITFAPE